MKGLSKVFYYSVNIPDVYYLFISVLVKLLEGNRFAQVAVVVKVHAFDCGLVGMT